MGAANFHKIMSVLHIILIIYMNLLHKSHISPYVYNQIAITVELVLLPSSVYTCGEPKHSTILPKYVNLMLIAAAFILPKYCVIYVCITGGYPRSNK